MTRLLLRSRRTRCDFTKIISKLLPSNHTVVVTFIDQREKFWLCVCVCVCVCVEYVENTKKKYVCMYVVRNKSYSFVPAASPGEK